MRNKGFFWFLTGLLTIICIYQLSFTWVSNSEEKKAEKEAKSLVAELKEKAKTDSVQFLPNGTQVDFSKSEWEEIAQAAYINDILRKRADKEVYPVFGSTFKEVKQRSLAFGLDLVGGMSVTLEISIPELVKSYARNPNDDKFKKPYEAAYELYSEQGQDFIDAFAAKHKEFNKGLELYKLFQISDIDELGTNSTDADVVAFLREKEGSSMDGVEEIMNRRINQFGVAQPNIQKDQENHRLYIELPGVQDEKTVAEKIQTTANLQFFETYDLQQIGNLWQQANILSMQPEVTETDEVETDDMVDSDSLTVAVDDSLDTEEELSMDEAIAAMDSTSGKGSLQELMTAFTMSSMGYTNNVAEVNKILRRADIKKIFPDDLAFMWSAGAEMVNSETGETGYILYAVKIPANGKAEVGGRDISNASTGYNSEKGLVTVNVEMTEEGGDRWAQMTQDNIGRPVAITMDSVVYSAPNVINAITDGRTEISGSFTIQEANDLTGLLNGGALPAPCVIKEQTRVGPTIGAENSRAGLMSFGAALVLVFIYMIFYYGKAGIIADIALFANILFIFGSLASFGAVLTLAGIAGIVLTIGMAVDANVLIFERVREEQAAGKDMKSAIDTGFKKALSSIIDANVTTMLTAVVLKSFGSGPIESFATTLIIGIFTSVFAALVITRLCMNWWLNKGKGMNFESKMTKNAFKNFDFNFVGNRKKYYIVSGVLVAIALFGLFSKGLNKSVEFSGGRTYTVKFAERVDQQIPTIQKNLDEMFVENGKSASTTLKTKTNNFQLEITTNYMLGVDSANIMVKDQLMAGLAKSQDVTGTANITESRNVSPTVSKELISSSMIAIALSLLIIFAYILIRFGKWQYSTGAIIAMLHDVTIVLGVFALLHGILPFNMDIDQAFIAAILTVIGYSINDTVIVFDRIRENLGLHKSSSEEEQINKSLNSTLSRTINTSMTTFIVLLIIFLFGGAAIKGFIFALLIGVLVGTYSSVCIATPVLIDFSKKKSLKEPVKATEEVVA